MFLKGLQEIRQTKKNTTVCSYIKILSLKSQKQTEQQPCFVDKPVFFHLWREALVMGLVPSDEPVSWMCGWMAAHDCWCTRALIINWWAPNGLTHSCMAEAARTCFIQHPLFRRCSYLQAGELYLHMHGSPARLSDLRWSVVLKCCPSLTKGPWTSSPCRPGRRPLTANMMPLSHFKDICCDFYW